MGIKYLFPTVWRNQGRGASRKPDPRYIQGVTILESAYYLLQGMQVPSGNISMTKEEVDCVVYVIS